MLSIAILFSLLVAVIRDHRGHPCESLALAGVVASTLPAVAAVATAFDKAVSGQSELYGIPLAYIDKIIAEHLAKKIGPLVKHREIHANTSSGSSLVLLQKRMNNDPDPNHNFQDESGSDLDEPGPEDQGEVDFEEPADGLDSDWWTPEEVCRDVSGNFVSAYCVDPTSFMYQCAYRDGPLAGQYAQPERGDCPDDTHCVDAVYQEHEMGQEQLPVLYVMCVPDQASLYEGGGDSENMDLQLMAEPIQQGHAQVNFALLDQYNDASVTAILIDLYGSKVDRVEKFTCSYAGQTMCKQEDDNVFDRESCLPTHLQALKRLQEVTCQLDLRSVVDAVLFIIIKGTKTAKRS